MKIIQMVVSKMFKVVICNGASEQIVFRGPEFACKQYVNTVHPNGIFVDFTGKKWAVKIERI